MAQKDNIQNAEFDQYKLEYKLFPFECPEIILTLT